ncbi:MAG: CTP synthase [Candidatus Moranbacteria bacterium]|nr:CTP synthase [Candidatus Moranbacteria bacterium]
MANRKNNHTRYIFVTGGVMSGVGKGVASSSIAAILQARGFKVTSIKIDPYVNVDAGTMNPTEHGEVFVLRDGTECDQDMGNYERFLECSLSQHNYMTTGSVYQTVIEKERGMFYKGKCVEVVPHIPYEVIRRIKKAGQHNKADIVVIEVGGTVGEYQNVLFLEAARMMRMDLPGKVLFVMVSFLPIPAKIGEMKTKPTQYAVRALNSVGIQPDIIIARAPVPLDNKRKEKISIFCNTRKRDVISAPDVESIYDVPLNFEKEDLSGNILQKLGLKPRKKDFSKWRELQKQIRNGERKVKVGVVGKYFATGSFVLSDVYISVIEALKHASYKANVKLELSWVDSEEFEKNPAKLSELKKYDGVVVPGGFGSRGVEGIISAIRFTRENKIPYLGLCYGMQLAVIEFARHAAGFKNAHTTEVNPKTPYPVIDILPEQKTLLNRSQYGGTMRLGSYPANIRANTLAAKLYGTNNLSERHRHRYEVNPKHIARLEKAGIVFSAVSPDRRLMETMELPQNIHPFFVASQFHPEFQSNPFNPHPLFYGFMKAAQK